MGPISSTEILTYMGVWEKGSGASNVLQGIFVPLKLVEQSEAVDIVVCHLGVYDPRV